jgi:serine/threonine protein phosphatase PrpC
VRTIIVPWILFCVGIVIVVVCFTRVSPLVGLAMTLILARLGFFRFLSTILATARSATTQTAFSEALRRSDTMAAPITDKKTHRGENQQLLYGVSCMQGWRRSMEDAHTTQLAGSNGSTCNIFAVFDGHCGSTIAQFCGSSLPQYVENTEAFRQKNYSKALVDGFFNMDRHLATHPTYRADRSGCTANAVLITPEGEIYCANAGDSRCVLCRDGQALPLSVDHKPHLPTEFQRIQAAKHFVWNRRVDGILALSRAIGDFQFKTRGHVSWEAQAVTCIPDVRGEKLDPNRDSFVVLACDGIWDVMTNEQVVSFVKAKLAAKVEPPQICELLMSNCLSPDPFGLGCDNMSVILIVFKPGLIVAGSATAGGAASGNPPSSGSPDSKHPPEKDSTSGLD